MDIRGKGADGNDVPAVRYKELPDQPSNSASGVNLHRAGTSLTNHSTNSTACLTVIESEYINFGAEAGFLERQSDIVMKEGAKLGETWGYVVVDRSCMEKTQKEEFFGDGEN